MHHVFLMVYHNRCINNREIILNFIDEKLRLTKVKQLTFSDSGS